MLQVGKACYLLVGGTGTQKILKVGKVAGVQEKVFTVEFEEKVAPEVGSDVTLFAEMKGKFFQTAAKVALRGEDPEKVSFGFEPFGQPVSAEQRSNFRVSTVTAELPIRVGSMADAILADVSAEGIAVITRGSLMLGQTVDVEFVGEGICFKGAMRVQVAKPLGGKTRYGLYAPTVKSPIRQALEKLTSTMQRYQLRRMSRAG